RLDDSQSRAVKDLRLPLLSARLRLADADPHKPLVERLLAEEGVSLAQFHLKGLRQLFFSKGERAAWCLPDQLHWETATDETRPGQLRLTLRFDLPRGSYATLLVKRIAAQVAASPLRP
ncbi:MAG: tRNA pseudouridine(13) synthase TruD, partial [Gemmataceae bacterium]|nr:tRNA pseudouridine(13) synthase TruD [Gemmataceae bacterium]